jgi:hypothetical protein
MKTNHASIESLEGRQLLSAAPAASHTIFSAGATSTTYVGTSTNQNHKTSAINLVLTDMRGVRTGVLYVNNSSGGKTPVNFTINSKLTFSFKFHLPGEENTVTGKLAADGEMISGKWISVSATGAKGGGTFSATEVVS